MNDIAQSLTKIVGEAYFSDQPEEAYFYARDPGLMPPTNRTMWSSRNVWKKYRRSSGLPAGKRYRSSPWGPAWH